MIKCRKSITFLFLCLVLLTVLSSISSVLADSTKEPGLLFYLSGDNKFTADYAGGDPNPSFLNDIEIIPDGACGSAFRCPDFTQIMVYFAPGNIYTERGTLSFFWRARDPFGKTPFHILQVPYSDHSSLDMIWLRIDYNGHGFDAFVTDVNLSRFRVSHMAQELPKPDQWIHFAVTWDETRGISFYVDGKLVGRKDANAVFYAGLDQIGMHGRLINPQYARTELNHTRGGDVDEIRIYNRMLSHKHIIRLAKGESAGEVLPLIRSLDNSIFRDEWWLRYGWNRPGDIPSPIEASSVCVRKVEIHDVFDLKQWVWKGTDGIRETTWPYVYNRSHLPGRTDYFIEPDWNCYSGSGKSVTFTMPEEKWNHLEISGAAFGQISLLTFDKEHQKDSNRHLFNRPSGQEKTFHRLCEPVQGGKIRFVNEKQETPIGEFQAYNVTPGQVPEGTVTLTYRLTAQAEPDNPGLDQLVEYISGRFLPDERQIMVALPSGAPRTPKTSRIENALPIVHILVPFDFRIIRPSWSTSAFSYTWENIYGGLDGIAIDLPALDVKPTHGEFFPMNIQVRDPLWPDRNMLDFTFSVKPGDAKTLWLDTRDRILPNEYSLYLTIAGAGQDFSPHDLEGARLRLIFKDRKEAVQEHETDRFTQVVDNHGNIVECHPNTKKLRMFDRFVRDLTDLLRVNPDHMQGRYYWSYVNGEQGWPTFEQPEAPADVPLWAFRQVENLKIIRQFINWWIDERQIGNGQFGGGLSDDGDFTNEFPGPALMGIEPEKITDSILRLMEAYYEEGLFTNGLPTIQTDELHSYEEGINVIPQTMLLDYGNPGVIERLMETAKAYDLITGINDLGERQIKTTYFSGTEIAEEGVWGRVKTNHSHLILHPGLVLVEFNGNPATKKLLLDIADGLLAHRKKDENGHYYLPAEIEFPGGKERGGRALGSALHLFWAAWRWTGNEKYLLPIVDEINRGNRGILGSLNANVIDMIEKRKTWGNSIAAGTNPQSGSNYMRHAAWQVSGNKSFLEECYADLIQINSQRMKMMTEGHWWIDRVHILSRELQRSRLGGIALWRNQIYPGHAVSWKFEAPASDQSVAIIIPDATPNKMSIIAFNLENEPVKAFMTAWDIEPGKWEITQGIDSDGDEVPDNSLRKRTVVLERTRQLELSFPPKKTTLVKLKLKSKAKPYWKRPDLGIGNDDVKVSGNKITVTVHSLGSVDAPKTVVALVNNDGKKLANVSVPSLKAPLDLNPKTTDITLKVPSGMNLKGCRVIIDPGEKLREITRLNNEVEI